MFHDPHQHERSEPMVAEEREQQTSDYDPNDTSNEEEFVVVVDGYPTGLAELRVPGYKDYRGFDFDTVLVAGMPMLVIDEWYVPRERIVAVVRESEWQRKKEAVKKKAAFN